MRLTYRGCRHGRDGGEPAGDGRVSTDLLIGHQDVVEHGEVPEVAGHQARAVDVRGRGDQGIGNADAVASTILKAVAASKPRDIDVDVPDIESSRQPLDPLMLALIADARIELCEG